MIGNGKLTLKLIWTLRSSHLIRTVGYYANCIYFSTIHTGVIECRPAATPDCTQTGLCLPPRICVRSRLLHRCAAGGGGGGGENYGNVCRFCQIFRNPSNCTQAHVAHGEREREREGGGNMSQTVAKKVAKTFRIGCKLLHIRSLGLCRNNIVAEK